MYYKKHREIPPLPKHITTECIRIVEENLKNNVPFITWYGRYENENKNSIAYMEPGQELLGTNGKGACGVGFFSIPVELIRSIIDFYQEINHPVLKNNIVYFLQVVAGDGNFVAPHIDDPDKRKTGLLYLIKSGGSNVRTKWYEPREEFKDLELENYTVIPYSRLVQVANHRLEEDKWHWMNFNKIHSVENQESVRIALWGTDHIFA